MHPNVVEEPAYRDKILIFRDRLHAGDLLAEKLGDYAEKTDVVMLAVPAGGVPVGYAVAKELRVPLEVIIVRKIQVPWNPEAGFGAVTWDGEIILNIPLMARLGLTEAVIARAVSKTEEAIGERVRKFRGDRPPPDLRGKGVILVDDGLASGYTMLAAVRSVKKEDPKATVVAVPTASLSAIELLAPEVDKLISLNIRSTPFFAVADAYKRWYDLSDEEVEEILKKAWTPPSQSRFPLKNASLP